METGYIIALIFFVIWIGFEIISFIKNKKSDKDNNKNG